MEQTMCLDGMQRTCCTWYLHNHGAAVCVVLYRIHKRLIDLHSPADVVKQITSIR